MMTESIVLNTSWDNNEFIVLDLEGTGSQHKQNEGIAEIAAILISRKRLTGNFYYRTLNPEIEIPAFITRIHGLKNEDLMNDPTISEVKFELIDYLNNRILVGHNVIVDYKLLKRKIPEYEPALILDTLKLSRYFCSDVTRHSLDELICRFQIKEELDLLPFKRSRHSAFYDAYATGIIFLKIIQEKFPSGASLDEISKICGIGLAKRESFTTENIQNKLF